MFPRIPYGRQHITPEDIQAVVDVLQSDYLTQGPHIREFEEAFAAYSGSKYAVAVANGTAALHLCAMALGVKPGKKVITTPITFVATPNCVRFCGGEVVFADIDPRTFLLDIAKVRTLLEQAPKGTYAGIIPVDFAGYPVNLEAFRELADEFGLWIIEDACHAPGGWFQDQKGERQKCGNGRFADLAIFSFHPVKHIAAGEGGMITTNDEALYKKLLNLRTHGIQQDQSLLTAHHGPWYYEMQELSFNYRLTDFQAALGNSQLKRAGEGLVRRHEIAERYFRSLDVPGLSLPEVPDGVHHAWHLFVIRTSRRDELIRYLRDINIWAQVHYIPAHLMPYYKGLGWKEGDLPVAEQYYSECLSIPMFPSMTEDEQGRVIDSLKTFFQVS